MEKIHPLVAKCYEKAKKDLNYSWNISDTLDRINIILINDQKGKKNKKINNVEWNDIDQYLSDSISKQEVIKSVKNICMSLVSSEKRELLKPYVSRIDPKKLAFILDKLSYEMIEAIEAKNLANKKMGLPMIGTIYRIDGWYLKGSWQNKNYIRYSDIIKDCWWKRFVYNSCAIPHYKLTEILENYDETINDNTIIKNLINWKIYLRKVNNIINALGTKKWKIIGWKIILKLEWEQIVAIWKSLECSDIEKIWAENLKTMSVLEIENYRSNYGD